MQKKREIISKMFTQRRTMAWISVLMFIAVTVSLAIGGEDDVSKEPKSIHLMRSVRGMGSGDGKHWRGITRNGNGNINDLTASRDTRSSRYKDKSSSKQDPGRIHKRSVATTFLPSLTRAIQTFSVSMYHRLKVNNPNFVFSPYSLHTALTMTFMGATQLTAEEMEQVLGLRELKQNAHQSYGILTQSLQQPSNVTLELANAVFLNPSYPVKDDFKFGLSNFYQARADVFQFDAPGGPEVPINQWVSNKTAKMIPAVLESGTIKKLTAMIIVNAIYFKGRWRNTFNAEETTEKDFYVTKDIKVKVPLMTKKGIYNYAESNYLKANILELPYTDDRYSMFIILPKIRNDLDAVEKFVDSDSLTNALDYLKAKGMKVFLPKFKVESGFKLKETLTQMGMVKAFGDATFDNISSRRDLRISDVIHKAVIEVTEEGTKAAAVTAVIMRARSKYKVMEFRADHPFMYIIRDNVNQMILFLGKYSGQK